ncbi:uncharacterized protein VTP21DRAFT_11671 [Calcarisporiella thermophila]|uniref:uncharacterized protein n=1 Tax=Calcarisporiella thermophila TaxID=911321 RepID=UPI0037432332
MNHFLLARELGTDHPNILKNAELTRRTLAIELCPNKDVAREHHGTVSCLEIENVEGRYLLSGGADSSICLYDLEEPLNQNRIRISAISKIPRNYGHRYGVSGVSWYPFDTGLFITSSFDHTIKIWDTNLMKEACIFDLEAKVYSHAISPIAEHCLVASATSDPRIRLCDLRTGAFTHTLPGHHGTVMTVRWSPTDEYLLASGASDRTIRFWDIRRASPCLISLDQHNTGQEPLSPTNTAHNGIVNGLAFTPDGYHLLSLGLDEKLRLWDLSSGARNTLVNYGPHIRNKYPHVLLPCISPPEACRRPLVFQPSDDRQILVFELYDGRLVKRLRGSYGRVTSIAWRPGKLELYTGGTDNEVLVWAPFFPEDEREKKIQEAQKDTWSDSD